jgi:hypothetical protein
MMFKEQFLNKKCIIRTYSAGVHAGTVTEISDNGKQCILVDAIRIWKWDNGGLSLSAIQKNGMKGGRTNATSNVGLTEAIEYLPVTDEVFETFKKYLED